MNDVSLMDHCGGWWNSGSIASSSAFAAHTDQVTRPSGSKFLYLGPSGLSGDARPPYVPQKILIHPWAGADNDDTAAMRVWGWASWQTQTPTDIAKRIQWHPVLLGGFDFTVSSSIKGVSGANLADTLFYADTITLRSNEGTTASHEIVSATGNIGARLTLSTLGFEILEFDISTNSLAADSAGVLVKKL